MIECKEFQATLEAQHAIFLIQYSLYLNRSVFLVRLFLFLDLVQPFLGTKQLRSKCFEHIVLSKLVFLVVGFCKKSLISAKKNSL